MRVEFDAAKDKINKGKHGISLARAADFDYDSALYIEDDSQDYGEVRLIAIGFLGLKLYVLVFSPRGEEAVRAIMLREANKHEMRKYDEES